MRDSVSRYLYLIFVGVGFIFLRSGYGKITEGKFVSTLGATLGKFASNNPYPPVKSFLEGFAIPNSVVFGNLTMWGEALVGLNLILLSLYLLFNNKASRATYLLLVVGLFFGTLLNLTFWLAAGWTSPSTDGLNLIMLIVQLVGLGFVLSKYKGSN